MPGRGKPGSGGHSGAERRGAYRVCTEFVARVAVTGSDDLLDDSEVIDLSSGGAKLVSGLEMDIGQRVSVSFGPAERTVNLAGTVRHVGRQKERRAYGVAWDPLPPSDSDLLQRVLMDCLARDASADAQELVAAAVAGDAPLGTGVAATMGRQVAEARALVAELQAMLLQATHEPARLYEAQQMVVGVRASLEALASLLQALMSIEAAKPVRRRAGAR